MESVQTFGGYSRVIFLANLTLFFRSTSNTSYFLRACLYLNPSLFMTCLMVLSETCISLHADLSLAKVNGPSVFLRFFTFLTKRRSWHLEISLFRQPLPCWHGWICPSQIHWTELRDTLHVAAISLCDFPLLGKRRINARFLFEIKPWKTIFKNGSFFL